MLIPRLGWESIKPMNKYLLDKHTLRQNHLCQAHDTCETFCRWSEALPAISIVDICVGVNKVHKITINSHDESLKTTGINMYYTTSELFVWVIYCVR